MEACFDLELLEEMREQASSFKPPVTSGYIDVLYNDLDKQAFEQLGYIEGEHFIMGNTHV